MHDDRKLDSPKTDLIQGVKYVSNQECSVYLGRIPLIENVIDFL